MEKLRAKNEHFFVAFLLRNPDLIAMFMSMSFTSIEFLFSLLFHLRTFVILFP